MRKLIIEPRTAGLTENQQTVRRRFMQNNAPTTRPDLWMTREQAAQALGVSARTVDRQRKDGSLGYCRGSLPGFDAAIRFWADDVLGRQELHP